MILSGYGQGPVRNRSAGRTALTRNAARDNQDRRAYDWLRRAKPRSNPRIKTAPRRTGGRDHQGGYRADALQRTASTVTELLDRIIGGHRWMIGRHGCRIRMDGDRCMALAGDTPAGWLGAGSLQGVQPGYAQRIIELYETSRVTAAARSCRRAAVAASAADHSPGGPQGVRLGYPQSFIVLYETLRVTAAARSCRRAAVVPAADHPPGGPGTPEEQARREWKNPGVRNRQQSWFYDTVAYYL